MQSFTKAVKEEIIKNEPKKACCQKTLFLACLFSEKISGKNFIFSSSSAPFARLVLKLAKKFSHEKSLWGFKEDKKRKKYRYIVFLPQKNITTTLKQISKKRCCRRAFIAGLFLSGAALNPPHKSYHLEFIINVGACHGMPLRGIFQKEGLSLKRYKYGKFYRIYFKKSDDIAKLLTIIKAHNALLKFEEARAIKETKNEVQRLVNCETANMEKTARAAVRQIKNIKFIVETIGLHKLAKDLMQVASLRLENPEDSLRELGEKADPPITRLTVSRKLKKIEEIAERIKGKPQRTRRINHREHREF